MAKLCEYSEALALMRSKGFYAIAAPDGEKNELFFVSNDGSLRVCKPVPPSPMSASSEASPYSLAQLESSGWVLPNYYYAVCDGGFRAFLGRLDANIAAVIGVLSAIQEKVIDLTLQEFLDTANGLLAKLRESIEEYRQVENNDNK